MRKDNTNEYLMSEARKAIARQGGEATKAKHGIEHYKRMSQKGVEARAQKKRAAKGCPECHSTMHLVYDETEVYVWCGSCDVSIDSSGNYTK